MQNNELCKIRQNILENISKYNESRRIEKKEGSSVKDNKPVPGGENGFVILGQINKTDYDFKHQRTCFYLGFTKLVELSRMVI